MTRSRQTAAPWLVAVVLACSLFASRRVCAQEPDPDPWWGPDKALHFGGSAAIAGGSYAISTQIWDDVGPRVAFAAGVALGAGVVKELLDAAGLGTASWKDLTWDVAGTAIGVGVSVGIDVATR